MDELDLGPSYAKIGEYASELALPHTGKILVYMEIELGMILTSIYVDAGEKVVWVDRSQELIDHVYKMWKSIAPEKRWATMSYVLTDGKFKASFRYPDEVDVEDFDDTRGDLVVESVFGDKPIEYPPPPPD